MGDMSVLILDLGPLKASYPRLDGIQRRLRGWAGGFGRGGDRRPMGQPVPSLTRPAGIPPERTARDREDTIWRG